MSAPETKVDTFSQTRGSGWKDTVAERPGVEEKQRTGSWEVGPHEPTASLEASVRQDSPQQPLQRLPFCRELWMGCDDWLVAEWIRLGQFLFHPNGKIQCLTASTYVQEGENQAELTSCGT